MRKYFLLFVLASATTVQAQQYMGFKAGVNVATATSALEAEFVQWGFHIGTYREAHVAKSFTIKGELLYSQKGWRFSTFEPTVGPLDLSFRLNYLDGMVGLYWEAFPRWAVYPGMQLSYLLKEKTTIQPSQLVVTYENPSRLEFAPVVGTRYQFTDHIGTDLRFTYSTWSDGGYKAVRSAVLMLSVEYTL